MSSQPVRFLRSEAMRPLPRPIGGGDLSSLWPLINIPESARLLVIAWLMDSMRSDTPFPLLELIGEQGSAKSTTQSLLRRLIDPNASNLRAAPKTVEDAFIGAGKGWLVSYENISYAPPMQDALCVMATGGGYAKRTLYSDLDETVITVKRPIVLNSICATVTAQDLLDRTISIEMPVITQRQEMGEIERLYEESHPIVVGALLDIFAKSLSCLPKVRLPSEKCPRLIEFTKLGMAVAVSLGGKESDFLDTFIASRSEAIARTIDESPVARALLVWFDAIQRQSIVLPLGTLFERVGFHRSGHSEAWPRSPKGFGDALRRAAPALRQMDVECRSLGKTGSYISWEVRECN